MGEDFPFARPGGFRIDGNDDALRSEFLGRSAHEFRRCTAAVLIETLSAPASNNLRISSNRTPPPTVSGKSTVPPFG